MMRGPASFLRNRDGAAAVEMVLVTPFLVALMFGAMELGNYFWDEHVVVKAVRDAARYAGRQSFVHYDCGAGTVDGTVQTAIQNVARTGQVSGGDARVYGWEDADISVSVACIAGTQGIYEKRTDGAPLVTVTATVAYTSLFGTIGFNTSGVQLVASAQSAVMGI